MSFNTHTTTSTIAYRNEQRERLSAQWPNWDFYHHMMSRPPLMVMDWLSQFYQALQGGTEAVERFIAGGGFQIETDENCDCDKPMSDEKAMSAYLAALKEWRSYPDVHIERRAKKFQTKFLWTYSEMRHGSEPHRLMHRLLWDELNVNIDDLEAHDALGWLHANHKAYNKAMRQLVKSTIGLDALREILVRDSDSDLDSEWGNLLRKDYIREMIENFVDSDEWCR